MISPASAYSLIQVGQFKQVLPFKITEHFTWGEVYTDTTPAELKALPLAYYQYALIQANLMELVRMTFRLPVVVHSWYRSPAHNARVGGSPHSQHMQAKATDFHIAGSYSPAQNLIVQQRLDGMSFMKYCGLEFTGGTWTHCDSRSRADGELYGYRFHR